MADEEKPYRVYGGGRGKGKVSTLGPERRRAQGGRRTGSQRASKSKPARSRQTVGTVVLFLAWVAAWSLASYFAFRDGVEARTGDSPPPPEALTSGGLIFNATTTILLLGTDHADRRGRQATHAPTRSCSSAPTPSTTGSNTSRSRATSTSNPGPRRGPDQRRVPDRRRAARDPDRRAASPGSPINHVAIVDFGEFKELIDKIGGIDVDVPEPILSNRFDCPYAPDGARRGRAGASPRASSTWTAGARSSTRGSARTGSTRARTT